MRILLVNWMDPEHPRAGGAERHLAEIFGRLARAGHEITLVAAGFRGGRPEARVSGMRVIRVGRRGTFAIRAPLLVRRLLRLERFDRLVEDLNKVPLPLPSDRVPHVVLTHHLWGRVAFAAAPFPLALLTWLAERTILRHSRAARFVAVSEATRWELIRLGVPGERVTVILNAADPPGPDDPSWRRSDPPLFVSVGRLVRYKRIDRLLRAAASLAAEGRRFEVVVAGEGPDARRLRWLARRLGLERWVRFPGRIGDVEKTGLLRAALANVVPSMKEGWGLTVLEAARQGTPSVVAPVSGLTEAVRHLEDGLWAPYHHLPGLDDALRYLMDHPAVAERLGRQAQRRAGARTWDDAAREMEDVLRDLAGPGQRRLEGSKAPETTPKRAS